MTVATRATPASHPAVKTNPLTRALAESRTRITAMMDNGLVATPIANGMTSLIALPMVFLLSMTCLSAEVAGIEPTGRGSPVPLVLKTRGATRPRSPPPANVARRRVRPRRSGLLEQGLAPAEAGRDAHDLRQFPARRRVRGEEPCGAGGA